MIQTHSNTHKEDGRGTAKASLPLILYASYMSHLRAFSLQLQLQLQLQLKPQIQAEGKD